MKHNPGGLGVMLALTGQPGRPSHFNTKLPGRGSRWLRVHRPTRFGWFNAISGAPAGVFVRGQVPRQVAPVEYLRLLGAV